MREKNEQIYARIILRIFHWWLSLTFKKYKCAIPYALAVLPLYLFTCIVFRYLVLLAKIGMASGTAYT